MKIVQFILFSSLILSSTTMLGQAERCGLERHLLNHLSIQKIDSVQKSNRTNIHEVILKNKNHVSPRKVLTIPIVVHILWNTPEQNISDEQVYSQIEILNSDFRALNSEIPNIQSEFKDLVADTEIEFCLANIDPEGNPTTGITRTRTDLPFFDLNSDALFDKNRGGVSNWNTGDYINIRVCNSLNSLGFGTPPNAFPANRQGISIQYKSFGNIGTALDNQPFHLGRTATHEMGHFLSLAHLWTKDCCCDNDGITDTPVALRSYSGQCPTGEEISCGSPDMYENYMNLTDDACMGMFSKGQKEVMITSLRTFRPLLLTSVKCQGTNRNPEFNFTITPNPAAQTIQLKTLSTFFPKGDLKIFDTSGKVLIDREDWPTRSILSVEKLESGVYFLDFRSGENRQILKFIKI